MIEICCWLNQNIIELFVINGTRGGTLKSWPEFVEGLFGGVLTGKIYVFWEFMGSIPFTKNIDWDLLASYNISPFLSVCIGRRMRSKPGLMNPDFLYEVV